eukprot:168440-Chlamydomonas_euryale.AAC.1
MGGARVGGLWPIFQAALSQQQRHRVRQGRATIEVRGGVAVWGGVGRCGGCGGVARLSKTGMECAAVHPRRPPPSKPLPSSTILSQMGQAKHACKRLEANPAHRNDFSLCYRPPRIYQQAQQ